MTYFTFGKSLSLLKDRHFWLIAVALTLTTTAASSPEDAEFVAGTLPVDTDGNPVHAHGGGILQQNGTFFWVGTTQKYAPAWISEGINLYTSTDLATWKYEGRILSEDQIRDEAFPFPHPYRIERPKILYNKKYSSYVMHFHLDTVSFGSPSVGMAKADSIYGPWQWVRAFKPDGRSSFDMTAWVDDDGKAYLLRSVDNQFLGVSRLTDDYLDTDSSTGICASSGQAEAPAVFKTAPDMYYVIASHLTGWAANAPQLFASQGKGLCDGNLHLVAPPARGPGSQTTFNSQPTFVFPLELGDGSPPLFIYMGDRWNFYGPGSVGEASYVWLPLVPRSDGSGYELHWLPRWRPRDMRGKTLPPVATQWHLEWHLSGWLSRMKEAARMTAGAMLPLRFRTEGQ